MRVIGLMSGTSLDGIDAAIVRIDGAAHDPDWSLELFHSTPYSAEQRARIHEAIVAGEQLLETRHVLAALRRHGGQLLDLLEAHGA